MIIGFSGKMASGKDTAVAYMMARTGGVRVAFADKLKAVVSDLWGVDAQVKDHHVRRLLQECGVKMREVDSGVWVNYALRKADAALKGGGNQRGRGPAPAVFISDVRFPNEADAILAAGGKVVRLYLPEPARLERVKRLYGMEPNDVRLTHESETALDSYPRFTQFVKSEYPDEMNGQLDSLIYTYRLALSY